MERVVSAESLYECDICKARATGFHFGSCKSCSACTAFFRRTCVLNRSYKCHGTNNCPISYKNKVLCKGCRWLKCLDAGMNREAVQKPRDVPNVRSYSTKSGVKRNKRFAIGIEQNSPTESVSSLPSITISDQKPNTDKRPNALDRFVQEERRIVERRRIMYCERPIASLLETNRECPFEIGDVKPLEFQTFGKTIRTHLLLIYEYLRSTIANYTDLDLADKITAYRKASLYHFVLDPSFISFQLGDRSKFVLQNGGFVSTIEGEDFGWEDEVEISRENKKKIYWPLLQRIVTEIVDQFRHLQISFEEFAALKGLISIQMTLADVSESAKQKLRGQLDELIRSLFQNYGDAYSETEKAERIGNIILLTSSIEEVSTNFVLSHHLLEFFGIWALDSIMLQFLKNKA